MGRLPTVSAAFSRMLAGVRNLAMQDRQQEREFTDPGVIQITL